MKSKEKGIAAPAIVALVAIVVLGSIGAYAYLTQQKAEKEAMEREKAAAMEKDKQEASAMTTDTSSSTMMQDKNATGTMMEGDGAMMHKYEGAILAGTPAAPLLDFKSSDYETALKSNKVIVLYFYANWCPICKAEFPEAQKAFDAQKSDNVIGFRVNFNDDETDKNEVALARQFGIAYQHTKVLIRSGQRIIKSPETWDAARYEAEITNALSK